MKNNFNSALIISCVALLGVIILAGLLLSKSEKLAYVDSGKLVEKYNDMMALRKELGEKTKKSQANLDTLSGEFERAMKKYEKDRVTMSEKERKLNEELLNNKQQQYMQYKEAVQAKAKEEEVKAATIVLNKLNNYIKQYGKTHHYKIIFGANSSGNVIYADEVINITDPIIEGANSEK